MKQYFVPLKPKDYLTLSGLIILAFGWLLIDQVFLDVVYQRFIVFMIIMFILFFLQFFINKPNHAYHYANTIAALTLSFIIVVSIITHMIIKKDFNYKSVLIWLVSAGMPYLGGFIYSLTKRKG
jgi:hypothetical protein